MGGRLLVRHLVLETTVNVVPTHSSHNEGLLL